MAITRDSHSDVAHLKSNNEEADTRTFFHIKYAENPEARIITQSPDTLLVINVAHFTTIASKELWFCTGVKDPVCVLYQFMISARS